MLILPHDCVFHWRASPFKSAEISALMTEGLLAEIRGTRRHLSTISLIRELFSCCLHQAFFHSFHIISFHGGSNCDILSILVQIQTTDGLKTINSHQQPVYAITYATLQELTVQNCMWASANICEAVQIHVVVLLTCTSM